MPNYLLSKLAREVNGMVVGEDVLISQVTSLENAKPDQIGFFMDVKYENLLAESKASAVVLSPQHANITNKSRLVVDNPYLAFAKISRLFNPQPQVEAGISPHAVISESAQIAKSAEIGAWVTIGEKVKIGERVIIHPGCTISDQVEIGEDSVLYPRSTIYSRCVIGKRVILQAGVVIGSDGFGNVKDNGEWLSIPQIGRVVIEDDVQIGANTTIDRGTLNDTLIKQGARLDNQIQIAHNVEIGRNTAIAGCVGIAGSTVIGSDCLIGGAVMIAGHLKIADKVTILAGTLVNGSISTSGVYAGYPVQSYRAWQKNAVYTRQLTTLNERVKTLEKLNKLKEGP